MLLRFNADRQADDDDVTKVSYHITDNYKKSLHAMTGFSGLRSILDRTKVLDHIFGDCKIVK